jgi:putative inorganic carbon (hco3(-)) transporter
VGTVGAAGRSPWIVGSRSEVEVSPVVLRGGIATRSPVISGGALVWGAAIGLAAVVYGTAIATGNVELLLAGGMCLAIPLAFAWRLDVGVLLLVLARPSLDLFAERSLASVAGLELNPASVLAVLVIAIGVPYMIERWRELRHAAAVGPYLAFAAVAAVGILVAPSKGSAVTEWLRMFSILVTYSLAFLATSSRAAVRRLLSAIIVSALVPAFVGVWQFSRGGAVVIGEFNRSTGTFVHPDPYGIYLALVIVTALAVALGGRGRWRWLSLFALAPLGIAIVGSYTRTAWVMVALGMIVLGAIRYRILLALAPVVVVLLVLLVPTTSSRFNDIRDPRQTTYGTGNSFQFRVTLWRENLPKAREKPLTGLGLNAIRQNDSHAEPVHSDYVRSLVETGVFGFAAYLWLLLAAAFGCVHSLRRVGRSGSRTLRIAALSGLTVSICYMLASGDSNLMTQVAVSGTAWTLIACGHAAGRSGVANQIDARQSPALLPNALLARCKTPTPGS